MDFEKIKTELDKFYGPKATPTTWMWNTKFSRKWQQSFSTKWKSCNGKLGFQSILASEESAGHGDKKLWWKQILSLLKLLTILKDMDEQIKLFHGLVGIVDCPNRKLSVIILPFNVDKPGSVYAQVRLVSRKRGGSKTSTKFLCELCSWWTYESTHCYDF